ncbi:MAG: hypothetical protein P4M08_07950 [Oligoflexia bacterium]|nr:hypothetical protein [Oligoflexia bacterium]
MSRLDPFTSHRLKKLIPEFRQRTGQLPTRQDLEENGFSSTQIDAAVKDKLIEPFYVTLTSGTIVKGFKLKDAD